MELLPSEVQECLQGPPTVFTQSPTDVRSFPRRRGGPEHGWHSIDDVKQLMFAYLKRAFGLLERVDVCVDTIPTNDSAAVISKWLRSYEMPVVASVVAQD